MNEDLVDDYLTRLERAAAVLPPDRRDDLLEGISEHLAGARAAGAAADEAAVRTLLDRLGEPEVVVAAAREDLPPEAPWAAGAPAPRGTGLELAAVLMLTVGSVFPPLLGWCVGVVLLWVSPLWRVREKLLGTLVWPGGPGGALLLGGVLSSGLGFADDRCTTQDGVTSCTSGALSPVGGWSLLAFVLPPLVVAVLLYRTARRRAPLLTPPVDHAPAAARWGGLEVAGVLLLGLGGLVLPLVPSLVGLLLVLSSSAWTRRDKVVGGLLTGLPLLVAAVSVGLFYVSNGALALGPAEAGLLGGYVGLLLGPVLGAGWFFARLQRRR